MKKLAFLLFATLLAFNAYSAYLRNVPVDLKQPDGAVIHCFITGDEFHRRVHDKDNYTIIRNPSMGYYVYAILRGDELIPTSYIVGRTDPKTLSIQPGCDIPTTQIEEKRATALKSAKTVTENPTKGDFNNIVISIRFSDQSPTTLSVQDYESKFNSTSNVSLKSYYKEVSNLQLNITSYFFPKPQDQAIIEYQDSHPRAYYSVYNGVNNPIGYKDGEWMEREQTLFKNAVDFVKNQIAESQLNIDLNNDGLVDNIVFVIQGNTDNWGNILWPMTSSLASQVFIGSKQVQQYNKQLSTLLNADIISHEFFHSLGAPDLYRYTNTEIDPIGAWDIMGVTGAQHMTTYMKWKYGKWFDNIPEITQPGTYTLKPVSQSPFACYKIPSPVSSTEYFIVEYRKKEGQLESAIPNNYIDGLIIYRINTQVPWGNAGGPPDELYIYRPNGDNISNGDVYLAAFSSNTRTTFSAETSPSCFLSNGKPGEIDISNITSAGNDISFTLNAVNLLPKPRNLKAITQNSQVLLSWNSPVKKGYTLLGYNVLMEGNSSPLNTSLITDTTYLTPNPGKESIYTYKLTAKFQQGESNPVTCMFLNATYPSVLDSLSLVVLYNQCDGPIWLHNENWLKGPISTWYGVTIENKRVVGLEFLPPSNLIRSGLKNSLPREIGNLTELRRLRLYNSDFTGPIPPEIGNLKKLEFLELDQNKFSGNIPKEIGNLTNLTDLWMQNNLLEGSLPIELSNLKNLKNMILGSNRFTGNIPPWIGDFSQMENLNLSQNFFTGIIPPEIGKLSKLEYLDLEGKVYIYRMFHGEIPIEIYNLQNLKVLFLEFNSLTGIISPEIGKLKKLESLTIWENELTGSIPKEINLLSNLICLDIGFNQLTGAIPNIGNLKKLEWLSFRFNQLVGSVPSDISFLTNLNFLHFRGNKLNNIPDFSGLLRLMDLTIDENNFTFEDIEPIVKIHFRDKWCSGLTYFPQAKIGKIDTIYCALNHPYTLSIYCGGKNNRYQWFKDGQAFSGIMMSPELTINTIILGNNGKFYCRVTNTIVPDLTIETNPITIIGENTLIANAGIDRGVEAGSIVELDGSSSYCPEGNALVYNWIAPDGIQLLNRSLATPSFIAPDVEYETAFEFALVVYNGLLNSTLDKVLITVKPKSDYNRPIADAGYNQTVNEGDIVTLNGSYSYDPNGKALTYLWTAPDGISISSTTDVNPKFIMPSIEGKKYYIFTLVVSDGIIESEPDQVVISIFMNNCSVDANNDVIPNDYPYEPKSGQSFTSIRSGSLEKIMLAVGHEDDFPFIILRKWVSDEYENIFDGEVIAISEKGSNRPAPINTKEMSTFIFKVQPYLISGEKYVLEVANGRPFLVNPGTYPAGHYYESTNLGYERDMRFALYVCKGENNPPIANVGVDQTINEGATVILNGSNSSDPDGDTLSFSWIVPSGITLNSNTGVKPTFTAPEVTANTSYSFMLVVNDGTVDSPVDQVLISVINVNKAPIANAGVDQSVNEGATVSLDGSASSDPDETPLTYKWSAPKGITLSSTTAVQPTFIAPEVKKDSILNFSLIVNDGLINSSSSTVKVTVSNVIKVGVSYLESPFFKIYPNPTAGMVNLDISGENGKEVDVIVTSLVGAEVFRKKITDEPKFQIDLSNQVNGIYMLKVISGNQQYISKIVVRKE